MNVFKKYPIPVPARYEKNKETPYGYLIVWYVEGGYLHNTGSHRSCW
jgi:hypothetical protein